MLNITLESLYALQNVTFSDDFYRNNYKEFNSIEDAIRDACQMDDNCWEGIDTEAFIESLHGQDIDDEVDYRKITNGWDESLDAAHLHTQIEEYAESLFNEDNPSDEEWDEEEWDAWQSDRGDYVEAQTQWAVALVSYVEAWQNSRRQEAMSLKLADLGPGGLIQISSEHRGSMAAVYLGGLEVLFDGKLIHLVGDVSKIEDRLYVQSLAA